jgi:hypothetical protein
MKTAFWTALAFTAVLASNHAATFDITYDLPSGLIPDGDLNGRADTRQIAGIQGTITDVSVFLDLEGTGLDGGWIGDLYVSLQHASALSVLINRPGRGPGDAYGSSGNGLEITLDDDATLGDVHFVPDGSLTILGSWAPDGRDVSPVATLSDFDAAQRTALLGDFGGLPVEGAWTLLVIDASSGGQMELQRWGLQIAYDPLVPTPFVPEASSWWISGASLVALGACFRRRPRIG